MIVLKPLTVDGSGWLEATWVNRTQLHDTEVQATEDTPAHILPGDIIETQVWCQSYHPTQIQMLRDKATEYETPLDEYEQMLADWVASYVPPEPAPAPSQFEKDQTRYQKRAAVKDQLMAYMAADNMSRVRSGVWTVADLTSLMGDPQLAAATNYMSTLSFELAAQVISQAQNALLTQEIRDNWVSRLQEHFYLEG